MGNGQNRVIFHCDCNSFYASVEELYNPSLRRVPMAVTWSGESRRGVILAKNELAKGFGVQTAETVHSALRKCPDLALTTARHPLYRDFSRRINEIYGQYTDLVEQFGIDESYLDVTGSLHLFGGDPMALAHQIRQRIHRDVGLTISVGVSFNKIFAKIGSDYKKPNAVTRIGPDNFREIVWPLPASSLLYVGKVTGEALNAMYIRTVGELAAADRAELARRFGKMGESLHAWANGLDNSPVSPDGGNPENQSVGNGITFSRNLAGWEDIRSGIAMLSDEVASRLRHSGLKCLTVQVTVKDPQFRVITRQRTLESPTWLAKELERHSMELLRASWSETAPIRMLTVTGSKLVPAESAGEQFSLFGGEAAARDREKRERLEQAVDGIRSKFGGASISLGSVVKGLDPGE